MQATTLTTAPERPPPAAPTDHTARITALAMLLMQVVVGLAAVLPLSTPAPSPIEAPATQFSADRAAALLGGIAGAPHPSGSSAQVQVREYLVGQIRQLGLDPQIDTRVVTRAQAGQPAAIGTVANVHATIAGTQPTGRILLVAHYDSVPTGPGAADNGGNVAAILEIARALLARPRPRNDIDLLFTDAEEQGLLGAQAFVDSGAAGDPARVVVVNLEARGVDGPAVMFQLAGTGLTPEIRSSGAVTTSLAVAIYRMLPHDTDLTVFDEAGMRGLNFAYFGGAAHCHTAHDAIDRISRNSLQDLGDATLTAARQLADADLTEPRAEAVFFSVFGTLVSYPGWLVLPLAGLALAALVGLVWVGCRRGLSLRGIGRAAVTLPAVLLGALVVGFGGWTVLARLRPDFALTFGTVYHPWPYAIGEAALLIVALAAWYRWARRTASFLDVAVSVLAWLSVLAMVSAVTVPEAAYLFTWPVLVGTATVGAALRYAAAGSPWRTVAGGAAAVPAMALVLPVVALLVPLLGLALLAVQLVLAVPLGAAMAGAAEPLPPRRVATAGMLALAVAAVATIGIGAAVDGYDASEPRPVSLGYVLEGDSGTAIWVSHGDVDQPGVGPLLTEGPISLDDRVPPLAGGTLQSGPAPVATDLVGPRIERLAAAEPGDIRLRITAPADTYSVAVAVDTSARQVLDATVNGAALAGGRTLPPTDAARWGWGFSYAAPPAAGIDLLIRTQGQGPMSVRVVTSSAGLPSGVGAPTLHPISPGRAGRRSPARPTSCAPSRSEDGRGFGCGRWDPLGASPPWRWQ